MPDNRTYDVIIIGSGITGGWAAKELCEKGLKVLMLERGRNVEHIKDYTTATTPLWELPHHGTLTPQEKKINYVQSRHYSFREDTKHFIINDTENPYTEAKRYDWIRADVVGGRSLLWGRASYRWSDLDFESNLRDGHGVDWPIRYKDLAPWYDHVEKFIGVSGNRDGIPHLPDGIFQPPFEMNVVEKYFKQQIESRFRDRHVIMGRTANLTEPVKGRGQCQSRNQCLRGCPFGAYFSTNASTLPAAYATNNFTLRPHALVNRIIYDEQKQRATGVEIIDMQTKKTEEYYARIIFCNASTMATAFILLNSTSNRFPNGLGNGSDQVGRNLMDHHKGTSVTAMVDGFEDRYYFGHRPSALFIPRFRNIKDKTPAFLRGYHMTASAYRPQGRSEEQIGAAFKEAMCEPGGWQIGMGAYGECLPYPENRLTLDKNKKDNWGRPMMVVDCEFKVNEKAMHEDMKNTAKETLEAAGFKNIVDNSSISFPGNANHEMGTARMGHDPKTSVLNKWNQLHECPNVYITDGSCMVSSACQNPSLTYMAITVRACDHAVGELKRMNV